MQPLSIQDFTNRIGRAVDQATAAGLDGLLVTPGPDLVYFTGYQPTAITERITMLVLHAATEPALVVPLLERPDAEGAAGVAAATAARSTYRSSTPTASPRPA